MIIDFHTHTFPKKILVSTMDILSKKAHMAPSVNGSREGLLKSMENSGVDYCVEFSVATSAKQVPHLNDLVIETAHSDLPLIPFGAMHPDYEDFELELQRLKEAGVKGIKVHPVYQGTHLNDDKYLKIFSVCKELDLVVLTHAGLDIGFPGMDLCAPQLALTIVEKIPDIKLVMAHMGGWKQWDDVKKYLKDTDILLDTSFSNGRINPIPGESYYSQEELALLNAEGFMSMIEEFGDARLLFGTDSPWTDQKKSIEFFNSLDISEDARINILGRNAQKLLKL